MARSSISTLEDRLAGEKEALALVETRMGGLAVEYEQAKDRLRDVEAMATHLKVEVRGRSEDGPDLEV